MAAARRLAIAGLWLVLAAVFALGAAGLATGFGGYPGTPERAELTYAGDQAVAPGLVAAAADLEDLSGTVERLGLSARTALAALVTPDLPLLESSVDEGTSEVGDITIKAASLQTRLAGLPGLAPTDSGLIGPSSALTLGPAAREQIATLSGAIGQVIRLPADWTKFSGGSLAAQQLTTLLVDHDASTAAAAALGRDRAYAEALEGLDRSDSLIAEATTMRGRLANTIDVSTLDEWLRRNAVYDAALRRLYAALVASGGVSDDEVRAAFEAELAAREQLPPDTRGLVIILSEIARGGLNEIAIGIEQAKAGLDDALAATAAARASTGASPAAPSPSGASQPVDSSP